MKTFQDKLANEAFEFAMIHALAFSYIAVLVELIR
jgi:hypothetical protein